MFVHLQCKYSPVLKRYRSQLTICLEPPSLQAVVVVGSHVTPVASRVFSCDSGQMKSDSSSSQSVSVSLNSSCKLLMLRLRVLHSSDHFKQNLSDVWVENTHHVSQRHVSLELTVQSDGDVVVLLGLKDSRSPFQNKRPCWEDTTSLLCVHLSFLFIYLFEFTEI